MSVNFAGSRNIGDRRRRRLAGENEAIEHQQKPANPQAGYLKIRRYEPDSAEVMRSPIASLIPHSKVSMWLICLSIPLLGLALFLLAWFRPFRAELRLGPIFDLNEGHAWRFLRGVLFLGCAGVCWIISWFRSASVRDFEGYFKSWYWSGWIFLLFGILAGCDLHLSFAHGLAKYTDLTYGHYFPFFWATPMIALLMDPFRCFLREMWHSRRSWLSLMGATSCGVFYLLSKVSFDITGDYATADIKLLIGLGSSVLFPALMFSALLSQTHHVMYVSSDPVAKRKSWLIHGTWSLLHRCFSGMRSLFAYMGDLRSHNKEERQAARTEKAERRAEQLAEKKRLKEEKRTESERLKEEKAAQAEQKKAELAADREKKKQAASAARKEQAAEKTRLAEEQKEKQAEQKRIAAEKKANAKAEQQQKKAEAEAKAVAAEAAKAEATQRAQEEKQKADEEKRQEQQSAPPRKKSKTQLRKERREQQKRQQQQEQEEAAAEANSLEPEESSRPAKPRIRVKTPAPEPETAPPEPVSEEMPETISMQGEQEETLDPELLKGLSKKEKRRVRKEFRDRQRSKAA